MNLRGDLRPGRTGFRPEKADFRPERADSRPERADFKPERADFRPERADFRPERAWGGLTDIRTNKSPPVFYRTSSPLGPPPKKLKSVTNGQTDGRTNTPMD